jgi:hypothetical protein
VLFDAERRPLVAPNQYLSYLHCLGRSPNTVRAYAHHLQAFSKVLVLRSTRLEGLDVDATRSVRRLVRSNPFARWQVTSQLDGQHHFGGRRFILRISG